MVFEAILEVMGITSIVPFMAVATDNKIIFSNKILKSSYEYMNFQSEGNFLIFLGSVVLGLLVLGNVFKVIMKWVTTRYGQQIGRYLGVKLFKSYLQKGYLFHTANNSSKLTSNIVLEVTRLTNNVLITLLTLNARLITIVFIGVGLVLTDFMATIIMMLLLGGSYGFIYLLIKKKLFENSKEMSSLSSRRMQTISEGFGGIKELLIHGKENVYLASYDEISDRYAKITTYNMFYPIVPRYFLEIISLGGVVLVIILVTIQGGSLAEILPVLSLFAMAGLKLLPCLQQFFSALTTLKANDYSLELLCDDLNSDVKARASRVVEKFEDPEIEIKSVSFKYPSSKNLIVKNINLKIEKINTIGFVGSSGAGKSTLVDILLGLLKPIEGEIDINGVNILSNSEKLQQWQNSIGYVPQTIYLLDCSIASNIAFSLEDSEIDMNRVKQVSKMAMLDEFIESTPHQYKTFVGENGIQLSGGQRQRIGIARALYTDPAVIIFDEATSALDNKTEKEIMKSIYGLSTNKTIILIAHRLSTVQNCDKIYFMENGSIVDSGKYDELLNSCEQFKKLTLA